MPKVEIDYSNTIIYKITCKDPSITDVYVGHTTNFVQRKQCHKQSCNNDKNPANNCKIYKVIRENGGWENWIMEIVNFFNCRDHYEARKKEQEYFTLLNATLNSIEPLPKPKEKKVVIKCSPKPICVLSNKNFICDFCSITCSRKTEWNRHINTKKHKINQNCENSNISHIACECGKIYKDRTGLWRHKKTCNNTILDPTEILDDDNKLISLILDVVKSNSELQKQNQDFQQQMIELCKNGIKIL